MCIADLLDIDPKHRPHAVIREEMEMKLLALREFDALNPSMPIAPAEVSHCMDAWAVGFYQEKAA